MNMIKAHKENFKAGRSSDIQYIVLHYTANNGDTAKGNASYFSRNATKTSAHFFIDEKETWQSVFEYDTAWHCGGSLQGNGGHAFYQKCNNSNSIGIEMCSYKDAKGTYHIKENTYRNAASLVKLLMDRHDVPIERVIRHYDVTGKLCPAPLVDKDAWADFKSRLTKKGDAEEVVTQIKIKINGQVKEVSAINKDGNNFVKLRDLEDAIEVDYDAVAKMPVVTTRR